MSKLIRNSLIILLSVPLFLYAQQVPSQLRVLTDANNYLLVTALAQTLPISQPTVFTNTRLKTDSSGSLQVVLTGTVTPTYPLSIPASTCAAPSLGESSAATTGIAFTATPSILNCISGVAITTLTGTNWTSTVRSVINQGTITTNLPIRDDSATWNNSGTTFTGWKLNVTDTASASGSLLMDLQVAGSSVYNVRKNGNVTANNYSPLNGNTSVVAGAAGAFIFNGSTTIKSPSNGTLTLYNSTQTDFARLQFGGMTNSFPALKRNSTDVQVRLADDSGYGGLVAGYISGVNGLRLGGSAVLSISSTAPSIASGFGTSPLVSTSNGTASFNITIGSGGTDSIGTINLPTASNGWNCFANDMTTPGVNATKQTASSATSATLTNYNTTTGIAVAWTAGDIIRIACFAN